MKNSELDIEKLREYAFKSLSHKLVKSCVLKNYFVTVIRYRNYEEGFVIIDTTKESTLNNEEFKNHSKYLSGLFFGEYTHWHNC